MDLLGGVEDLEREDGEPVDDEAGGLGVQGRVGRRRWREGEQGLVDLLGEVIAELVEAVDGALGGGERCVRGVRVAGVVLAVPEVEVRLMLFEDELLEGRCGLRRGRGGVMAVGGGEVVERRDAGCFEHWAVRKA